jgi:hypothetical protein
VAIILSREFILSIHNTINFYDEEKIFYSVCIVLLRYGGNRYSRQARLAHNHPE